MRTLMDSIAFWSISSRLPVKITPLTTRSGEELVELMERRPRTRMLALPPPGEASVTMFTPGSLPCMEFSMLGSLSLLAPFMSITATAPVRSALRCTW